MLKKMKSMGLVVGSAIASAALPVVALANEVDASTTITAAATEVKTDALAALAAVAPIGISIGGAYLVFRLGWRFFKGLAK